MTNIFKVKPKGWRLAFYFIASSLSTTIVLMDKGKSGFEFGDFLIFFFWAMFLAQLLGFIFPRKIELKDTYLEHTYLFNKTTIPYEEVKVFLSKNFLAKYYLITDTKRQRKIRFNGISDTFIDEFEEALEIKLIENNIT